MSKKINQAFEILESDGNSVVFKRVLPKKGRKNKEVLDIELNLPTLTLHYFSFDDYIRLKELEKELLLELPDKAKRDSMLVKISKFFEL